jgi:two-component system, OmpR family, sensor histidine kinase VicK
LKVSTSSSGNEETKIVYGTENIINQMLQIFPKIKERYDICIDCEGVAAFVENQPLWHEYTALKSRPVGLRFLTEVTVSNISYCREIMKVAELRHLDELKTNFGIADGSIYSTNVTLADEHIPTQMIFSNVKALAQGQQYIFDTLWNKAVPAEQKIKEIEEGMPRYETMMMKDAHEITKVITLMLERSNQVCVCVTTAGCLQFSYNNFFEIKKKLVDRQEKRGDHKGVKYITIINNETAAIVKKLIGTRFQVRHIKSLPPMSFVFTDKEVMATIEKMEEGKLVQNVLFSNEPEYVEHFSTIFEELWENGIDAKLRIEDIEVGRETDEELANAKRYLNDVLRVLSNMESSAIGSEPIVR